MGIWHGTLSLKVFNCILALSACVQCGQLGLGRFSNSNEPAEISALRGVKVAAISAGGMHSGIVTESGKLVSQ